MSDISALESRITGALDRIARQIEAGRATPAPAAPAVPDPGLTEALEVERTTNARLMAAREKHEARIERMEARVLRLTERLQEAEAERARLNIVVSELTEANEALAAANAAHRDGSDIIDDAQATQLANLRAARSADLAELDELLAELAPIVKEG